MTFIGLSLVCTQTIKNASNIINIHKNTENTGYEYSECAYSPEMAGNKCPPKTVNIHEFRAVKG